MSQLAYFNLPDVGEGLTEAEIVSWKVKPGDNVGVNQVIVEIETAKSLVELPCPFAGVVSELLAKEGDTVEVGKPIISVTVAGPVVGQTPAVDPAAAASAAASASASVSDTAASVSAEEKQPNLVGYGASGHSASRRRGRTSSNVLPVQTAAAAALPVASVTTAMPIISANDESIIAKPPVRKLAKDLGVDLANVKATGTAGEVTREDVLAAASQASVFRNLSTPEAPSAREERIPVKGVRKAIANAMVSVGFHRTSREHLC